jgi:DNA-binding transcriptional LysR family regulator
MNLDLNHVDAFVTAAETLHFGHAARRLHLTQQGISHRIARLERILGAQLFTRDGRTVTLTAAGYRFLPYARQLLATAAAAVADAHRNHGRTAVGPGSSSHLVPGAGRVPSSR